MGSEAAARIKINKLLEAAGWRFFADADGPANIQLTAQLEVMPEPSSTTSLAISSGSRDSHLETAIGSYLMVLRDIGIRRPSGHDINTI